MDLRYCKPLDLVLTVRPTDVVVSHDGVPCRIWHGTDGNESLYVLFVHRVAASEPGAQEKLEALLDELPPPTLLSQLKPREGDSK